MKARAYAGALLALSCAVVLSAPWAPGVPAGGEGLPLASRGVLLAADDLQLLEEDEAGGASVRAVPELEAKKANEEAAQKTRESVPRAPTFVPMNNALNVFRGSLMRQDHKTRVAGEVASEAASKKAAADAAALALANGGSLFSA